MYKYVGLDLSLTSTGIAIVQAKSPLTDEYSLTTKLVKSKGKADADYPTQLERVNTIADRIAQVLAEQSPDYVAIEGPSLASRHGRVHQRHGLWWVVYGQVLDRLPCTVEVIPPTTLKKWFTGKGNANKSMMAEVALALVGRPLDTDDEVDAFALALMAKEMASVGGVHTGVDG